MHMHMGFSWSTDIGDLFIKGFSINGALAVTILCIVLFLLSIVSEGMKVHRTRSKARTAREQRCAPNSENTTLLNGTRSSFLVEALQALKAVSIFAFHNILMYALMLVVMMFNGYVFIAVVLGAGVGYFLFGHLSVKTNMENVQAIRTKMICSTRCAASENEPCSSGTTPIISHCPIVGAEPSCSNVMNMSRTSDDSTISESSVVDEREIQT